SVSACYGGHPDQARESPSGCVFRTRCPSALEACAGAVPQLREVAPGHFKACIRDDLN
ncbi:oligopeptide/dipeptide ABC transporter ATP-binding protein, partial [Rhizobium ruizarguesonis]